MRPDGPVSDVLASVCGSSGPECSGRTACRREAVAPECVSAAVLQFCCSDTSSAASFAASPRLYEALHVLRHAVCVVGTASAGRAGGRCSPQLLELASMRSVPVAICAAHCVLQVFLSLAYIADRQRAQPFQHT